MKIFRTLLPVLAFVGLFSGSAYAQFAPEKHFEQHHCDKGDISRFDNNSSSKDWEELYDFVTSKRMTNLKEKSCNLAIAGDVRIDWRHTNEKTYIEDAAESDHIRGGNSFDYFGHPISRNDFDIEFNLYLDYCLERTWFVAHLQFDNTAGIDFNDHECVSDGLGEEAPIYLEEGDAKGLHGSGFCCDLCLKKAYFGYNICTCGDTRFDIEIGRRHLYHVFDSEVQFLSRFDGILLRYTSHWDCMGDWYAYLGGFVIDERVNHFGWVTELGMLNFYDCGFDMKYSFIDWKKNGKNRCFEKNPEGAKFRISQLTTAYNFNAECLCVPIKVYSAFLINHDAESFEAFNNGDEVDDKDKAWYIGLRMGQVCHCGDWALDMQYQYVQAQAIPDQDVSGIGRGNWFDERTTNTARGNTNYKGWRIEALYAFTDNLVMNARYEASREVSKDIGGTHHYNQFRLETIYAF